MLYVFLVPRRRTNQERSDETRAALLQAARRYFRSRPYAEASTPDIAAAAKMTRGALYHHFEDKLALFRTVVEEEARAVAEEIEGAAPTATSAREALIAGSDAYLNAMAVPGRTRILLLDGPAALGRADIDAIIAKHGDRTLREGLACSLAPQPPDDVLTALTHTLGAAFDRAALAIDAGAERGPYRDALVLLIDGLLSTP